MTKGRTQMRQAPRTTTSRAKPMIAKTGYTTNKRIYNEGGRVKSR